MWHISHINYLMINFDDRFFIFIACMLSCSLSCTFYIWNRCLRAFHLVSTMFGAIICGRQNNSTNEKKRKIYIYAYKQRDTHTYRMKRNEYALRMRVSNEAKNVSNIKYIWILLRHANFKLLLVYRYLYGICHYSYLYRIFCVHSPNADISFRAH